MVDRVCPNNLQKFIRLASTVNVAYKTDEKKMFHDRGAAVLRELAKRLEITGPYSIHHNQGGIAVSGEITLHSETLYIQFSQSALGFLTGFMYRRCEGLKDYTGGRNNWMKWEELADLDQAAQTILKNTLA
jgi:hypothetical protein